MKPRAINAPLLSLIMLTTLDGHPVWVESTQVQIVRHSLDCAHGQATALSVGSRALCVKETIEQVRDAVTKGNAVVPWVGGE